MKILYDNVSADYVFPLSKKDVGNVKNYINSDILSKIKHIKFGCNTRTTQEGRTVKRGKNYDIRINFCLKNLKSILLTDKKEYIEEIRKFGGKCDLASRMIDWNLKDAKRYALYILLHEVGHIVYCEKYLNGNFQTKTTLKEEKWCNIFSVELLEKLYKKKK